MQIIDEERKVDTNLLTENLDERAKEVIEKEKNETKKRLVNNIANTIAKQRIGARQIDQIIIENYRGVNPLNTASLVEN